MLQKFLAIFSVPYALYLLLSRMKNNRQISENFKLSEFTRTNWPLPNVPGKSDINNVQILVKSVLQPLRDYLGVPVNVTSGYRSYLVNKAVGGADNSQHRTGQAADIVVRGYDPVKLLRIIQNMGLPYDQLISEYSGHKSWLHISVKEAGNRSQSLKFENGEYLFI